MELRSLLLVLLVATATALLCSSEASASVSRASGGAGASRRGWLVEGNRTSLAYTLEGRDQVGWRAGPGGVWCGLLFNLWLH